MANSDFCHMLEAYQQRPLILMVTPRSIWPGGQTSSLLRRDLLASSGFLGMKECAREFEDF